MLITLFNTRLYFISHFKALNRHFQIRIIIDHDLYIYYRAEN